MKKQLSKVFLIILFAVCMAVLLLCGGILLFGMELPEELKEKDQSKQVENWDLYTVSLYDVCPVVGKGKVLLHIVEEDDYGRVLFKVTEDSALYRSYYGKNFKEQITYYAVCQKSEKGLVYFYEDMSYRLFSSPGAVTEEAINTLKAQNDWNETFAEEKCVVAEQREDADLFSSPDYYEAPNVKKKILQELDLAEDETAACQAVAFDQNKKTLFMVVNYTDHADENGNHPMESVFFVITDRKGNFDAEKDILFAHDIWDYAEELHAFKQAHDWKR